ncbi:MAG TPA: DUF2238 domain-containing protein [Candidatus Didemnitutus sp.]|nr:DUF2238 domain-containing protein [Candidatus Didemnitutus sp.]
MPSPKKPRLVRTRQKVNAIIAALRRIPRARFVGILAVLLGCVIFRSGWHARVPGTWLMENGLVVVLLIPMAMTYRRMPLSRVSYALIFVFLCLHEIGAHWTYAHVPYDATVQRLFGFSIDQMMGFTRNDYDRLVHFSYGLLFAYPLREVFLRIASVRGFWGYFLPLDFTMSTSMIYELIEWIAADVVGSDAGNDFLGSQGDPWDSQKDMAMASLGALLAMTVIALITWRYKRDFAREFADSLKLRRTAPMGEDEIARIQISAGR